MLGELRDALGQQPPAVLSVGDGGVRFDPLVHSPCDVSGEVDTQAVVTEGLTCPSAHRG